MFCGESDAVLPSGVSNFTALVFCVWDVAHIALSSVPHSRAVGTAARSLEVCTRVLRHPVDPQQKVLWFRPLTITAALAVQGDIRCHRKLNSLKLPTWHLDVSSQTS